MCENLNSTIQQDISVSWSVSVKGEVSQDHRPVLNPQTFYNPTTPPPTTVIPIGIFLLDKTHSPSGGFTSVRTSLFRKRQAFTYLGVLITNFKIRE